MKYYETAVLHFKRDQILLRVQLTTFQPKLTEN